MIFVLFRAKLAKAKSQGIVKGKEFIGRVKRYGRRHGLPVKVVAERGKGSHVTLYLGKRFTVVKDRKKEIGKGLYHGMLKQLGIDDEI